MMSFSNVQVSLLNPMLLQVALFVVCRTHVQERAFGMI